MKAVDREFASGAAVTLVGPIEPFAFGASVQADAND